MGKENLPNRMAEGSWGKTDLNLASKVRARVTGKPFSAQENACSTIESAQNEVKRKISARALPRFRNSERYETILLDFIAFERAAVKTYYPGNRQTSKPAVICRKIRYGESPRRDVDQRGGLETKRGNKEVGKVKALADPFTGRTAGQESKWT